MKTNYYDLIDGLALVCVTSCGMLALVTWQARRIARRSLTAAAQLAARLAVAEKRLEFLAGKSTQYGSHLAWLDARLRHHSRNAPSRTASGTPSPQPVSQMNGKSADSNSQPRLSNTELRHRVLALSRRGLDAEQIADTLNLPHGEVELIIALYTRVAA